MELIFADSNPDGSCSFVGSDFRGRELSEALSWVANDFDKSCPSVIFKVIEHGLTMRTYDVECKNNYPVDALATELEGMYVLSCQGSGYGPVMALTFEVGTRYQYLMYYDGVPEPTEPYEPWLS